VTATTVTLPCSRCGGACVTLVPPPMTKDARRLISPLLKFAALHTGQAIQLPENGATWFDIIAATPADLSTALELTCAFCARLLEDAPAVLHAKN
jgi:hypothetical protein